MWGSRGRGRASMNSMLSEKNVRTRSEPGRGGYRVKFFSFLLVTVTVARCWFTAGRSAVGTFVVMHLLLLEWKQYHICKHINKDKDPEVLWNVQISATFVTHIVSSLKRFYQTINIHRIEKSLLWSQYVNHPTISRQWCVASLRIQRPGK